MREPFRLTEGRHLTAEDKKKVIISENLAEMNGLSIGDELRGVVTEDRVIGAKQGIGTGYAYEITGIFSIEEAQQGGSANRAECEMYENCMFIDEESGFEILENIRLTERQYLNGLTLWASDPADLYEMQDVVMAVPGYGWDVYFINTNAPEYEKSAEPMIRMEKIMGIFLLVVTGISSLKILRRSPKELLTIQS